MTKLNLALIGCRGISGAHVDGYEKLKDDLCVPAICDLVEERAKEKACQIGKFQEEIPAVFSDFHEMLREVPSIDAVDICTGHASHHEIAVDCLAKGKHALVEKPLGITIKASRKIIDAAEEHNRILGVGEETRNSLQQRARKWAIDRGMIGDSRFLWWSDAEERLAEWGWRDFKLKAGGGWSFDGGVHYADQWRDILGEPEEVYAQIGRFEPFRYENFDSQPSHSFFHKFEWPPGPLKENPKKVDVEGTVMASIKFEDDYLLQYNYSCEAPAKTIRNRILYGDNGCLDFDEGLISREERMSLDELKKAFLKSIDEKTKNELFPTGEEDEAPEANNIGDFVKSIRKGKTPEMNGKEGLHDVAVPMAMYESSALGGPVSMQDVVNEKIEKYQREINDHLGI